MGIELTYENVDTLEEASETDFGFNANCGVIRDNNVIVGFYNLYVDKPTIHLQELEILEEFRSVGYGTKFLKKLFTIYPECTEIAGIALEDSASFYANFNSSFETTCDTCPNASNCKYLLNSDICDDYSGNVFILQKENLLVTN